MPRQRCGDLRVGEVILHAPSANGEMAAFVATYHGNLSFVYLLYNEGAYNFDRHPATPMCVLGFVSQPYAYNLMPLIVSGVVGCVLTRTYVSYRVLSGSADIAM